MLVTKSFLTELTYEVVGAAIDVHKSLGPGLLENVYHKFMKHELKLRGINFQSEKKITTIYKGLEMDTLLRCDLFIENILPVELKAVDQIKPLFETQLLSYMKLLKSPKGILINYNCYNLFQDGQKTYVNELYRVLPE